MIIIKKFVNKETLWRIECKNIKAFKKFQNCI